MKTLKKWIMMFALAASLFGFAGCALFGGLSSGSSNSREFKLTGVQAHSLKRGIILKFGTLASI